MNKKFIIVLTTCLFSLNLGLFSSFAHGKETSTKLQAFRSQKGKLIIEEYYELGEIAGDRELGQKIGFTALVIYEPGEESKRVRGLKIKSTWSIDEDETTYYAFIDFEEIGALSKAIGYIINISNKWKNKEKEYTVISFTTKDDFKIVFYQNKKKQNALSFIEGYGIVFSPPQELNSMKTLIDKGLNLLNKK